MWGELPAPEFGRYERVVVRGEGVRCADVRGVSGTVIGLDSSAVRRNPDVPGRWLYVVRLWPHPVWRTVFQSDLVSEGSFDPESAHLGERPEISFDTLLEEDNGWAEGTYRLPGELWKVVIFQKDDVPDLRCESSNWPSPTRWEREGTGVVIRFPRTARMGRAELLQSLSLAVGLGDWVQVHGPDSMMLR